MQPQKPLPEMNVGKRFLSNTIVNFGGQGILLVLSFVTAPFLTHRLGVELFGIVALVQVVAGFAGIINLGVGRALTKYVSELYWKNNVEEINRLFQTAWSISLLAGLVVFVLLVAPKHAIGELFFRGGPESRAIVDFAIVIAAFGLVSSILLETTSGICGATQRFDISNAVNVASGIVRQLGSVVVLAIGYSVRAVLVVNLLANILAVISFAVVSCYLIRGLKLLPSFSFSAFKKLFAFSFPLFLSAISALIVSRVDRFILAYFLPLSAVTFYTLPFSLSEKAATGVANVTSVVYPFTSELHSKGSQARLHELYLRSTKMLTLVTLPFSVVLIAIPDLILRYWLGVEFALQGSTALRILGVATFLNAASAVATVTSLGVGEAWIPAVFALLSSLINVVCNIALIPRYGINGAALGAMLPHLFVVPAFVLVVTRNLELSCWRVLSHGFVRPALCASVELVVLLVCSRYINSLLNLLLFGAVSLIAYAVASFFGAMSDEEKRMLLRRPALNLSGR